MTKQLYLEAIEALRQRVEAMGEGEELPVLQMLAEEIVKALARFSVAERAESAEAVPPEVARFLAAESAEYAAEPPPPLVIDAWAWRSAGLLLETPTAQPQADDDDLTALEDDDLFKGGDWDPEEDEEWDEVDALIEANNAGMGLAGDDDDNSDLWEDDPDVAREYATEEDEEL